ncbi:hypothetical protein N2152v2_010718 [Parachlorella kessleri]
MEGGRRQACQKKHAASVLLASLAAAAQALVLPGPVLADTSTSAPQPTVDAVASAPRSPSSSTDATSSGRLVEELQVSASHMASALQSVGIAAEAPPLAPPSASRPQPAVADVAEAAPAPARPVAGGPEKFQAAVDALTGGPAGSDRGGSAVGGQLIASSVQMEVPPRASGMAPEEPQPAQGGVMQGRQQEPAGSGLAGPQESLGMLAADIDEVLSAADLPALEAPGLPTYAELLAMYGLGSPAEVTTAAGEGGALLAGIDSRAVSEQAVAANSVKAERAAAGNTSQAPANAAAGAGSAGQRPAVGNLPAPQEAIAAIAELELVATGDSLAAPQDGGASDASAGTQLPATSATVDATGMDTSEGVAQQAKQL